MSVQNSIDAINRSVRQLSIEFERFFRGALTVPPEQEAEALRVRIRDLHQSVNTSAERFQLQSLEARFNSYVELFRKRLRQRELGKEATQAAQVEPLHDVDSGIQVTGAIDLDAANALWKGLYSQSVQATTVDPEGFQRYLDKQVERIKEKTGCREVLLRVIERDGKKRLRARPLDPPEGGGS